MSTQQLNEVCVVFSLSVFHDDKYFAIISSFLHFTMYIGIRNHQPSVAKQRQWNVDASDIQLHMSFRYHHDVTWFSTNQPCLSFSFPHVDLANFVCLKPYGVPAVVDSSSL